MCEIWIQKQSGKVVATQKAYFCEHYNEIFAQMISEWQDFGNQDNKVWLQYSASYLFRTNGISWAMDLCLPTTFSDYQLPENFADSLKELKFVIYTHNSRDHIDSRTVKALAHLPILWIIPHHMITFFETLGVPTDNIIEIKFGDNIKIEGIDIHAFESIHWQTPENKEPIETGYFIKASNSHLLFLGDVRTYDSSLFPKFDSVDWLFAHVWLGSNQALSFPPLLLNAFSYFILDFKPRSVHLGHLHEVMRDPENYWSHIHAGMVIDQINIKDPKVRVVASRRGEGELL